MRRLSVTCVGMMLLLVAAGCTTGPASDESATSASPSPSPRPTEWLELVNAAGKLESLEYGRASLRFTTTKGPVRILVGFGPAPAWHVDTARFHYSLYPESEGDAVLPAVTLKRLAETTTPTTKSKYVLLGRDDLEAGRYSLLYWGAGWYGITVFLAK